MSMNKIGGTSCVKGGGQVENPFEFILDPEFYDSFRNENLNLLELDLDYKLLDLFYFENDYED